MNEYQMMFKATIRVALVIAVFGLTAVGTSAASARTGASNPAVFRDRAGNPVLVIQLQPGPNQGTFDFIVNGVGDYHGTVPVRQSGPIFHLQATVQPVLLVPTALPQTVSLRFEGELDSGSGQASVNAWSGAHHYHLVTANGVEADAAKTAQRVLNAVVARNWATLYPLMEPQLQKLYTESQFGQVMANAKPIIIAAKLNGRGSTTRTMGYPIFTQPVLITVGKPNGAMMTYPINMYLVLENSTWYLLSTDTPPAA